MSERERRLQQAIADACLGSESGAAIAGDLRAFLEKRGVAPEDIEAVLAAPRRLAVYRSLVRNGLGAVVQRMLPRTRARMNAACAGRFDADMAAFADEVGPRTHYLRDVPAELFAWAEPRWRSDPAIPPYLVDLAAFELASFAVAASAAVSARTATEIALDRPLALAESARLLRLGWAVHELPGSDDAPEAGSGADVQPAAEAPPRRAVYLLAYRDADHTVRWLELTELAAAVVERLFARQPLGAAVQGACEEHGVAPAVVLPDVARLLADLAHRGVVLGAGG